MDWNMIGRLFILVIGCLMWGHFAFRQTPELDGVTNAEIYRASLFLLLLRGWGIICFDMFDLFPL
jgi:hypothetical protein